GWKPRKPLDRYQAGLVAGELKQPGGHYFSVLSIGTQRPEHGCGGGRKKSRFGCIPMRATIRTWNTATVRGLRPRSMRAKFTRWPGTVYTPANCSRSPNAGRPMSEVTRILSAIEYGDPHSADQLLPLVYDELRKLAAQKLAQEKPGQTLQATALVH